MRLKTHKWLFLAVGFLLSCGKERTLNVNEHWSIDPPLSQVQKSPIQIEVGRNFSNNGNSESKINVQVSGEASAQYSKLNISIANQNFSIGEASINFSSLINQDIQVTDSGKSLLTMKVPHGFFLSSPSSENQKICFKTPISGSVIRWDDIQSGSLFNISIDTYSTQPADYGSWVPEFDLLQKLYPGTTPSSDISKLEDIAVTVTLTRGYTNTINQIPVTVTTKESFPSIISFNCSN